MIEEVQHPNGERIVDQSGTAVSDVYEAFSSDRRRAVLSVLAEETRPIDVAALARAVAAREERVPPEAVSPASIDDVHLTLYHVHLPKLAECGLIELDDDGAVFGTDAIP